VIGDLEDKDDRFRFKDVPCESERFLFWAWLSLGVFFVLTLPLTPGGPSLTAFIWALVPFSLAWRNFSDWRKRNG
jgi:hypothetical protein